MSQPALTLFRWGRPIQPQFLAGKKTERRLNNVRNKKVLHWRRWFSPEFLCLVRSTMSPNSIRLAAMLGSIRRKTDLLLRRHLRLGLALVWKVKDGETVDDLVALLRMLAELNSVRGAPVSGLGLAERNAWISDVKRKFGLSFGGETSLSLGH